MMRFMSQPDTVDAWLKAATRGLCAPAVERIGEEIRDFYQSAVDEAIDRGMSSREAEAHALQQLGPAARSRREFRRQHLTKFDFWTLRATLDARMMLGGYGRRVSWMNVVWMPFLFLPVLSDWGTGMTRLVVYLPLVSIACLMLALCIPSRKLDRVIDARWTLLLNFIVSQTLQFYFYAWMLFTIFYAAPSVLPDRLHSTAVLVVCAYCAAAFAALLLSSVSVSGKLLADRTGGLTREFHAALAGARHFVRPLK